MDESAACATLSATKKTRKWSKGSLGRYPGRRTQKKQRVGSLVTPFPSKRQPSSTTSVPDQESHDTHISTTNINQHREKYLRNRADYAKRQCGKKDEQVKNLLVENAKIKESQLDQEKDHCVINMKQKNKLAATEASASKVSASLTGRVTQLSKALVKEKEKISFVKKALVKEKEKISVVKKAAKINLNQVKDLMQKKHDEQHKALLEQHKEDITTQANAHSSVLVEMKVTAEATAAAKENDHSSVLVKMKETAKTKVESVRVKGENKLGGSKRASAAARNRLKVST